MNRKLKTLGLALVAVFALTAISASSASAFFTSTEDHVEVKGVQTGTDTFTTNAGTVKCGEATYVGTSTSGTSSAEQSVTPTYTECTAFGFVNTKIDTNGCSYNFTTISGTSEGGAVHINCPAGASIVVTAFNCEVTVPAQTVATGVTYHNSAAGVTPMDILITANLKGITYIQHSKSFPGCSTSGTGTATSLYHDGTYVSTGTTVRAFNTEGKQLDLTVS